MLQYQCNSNYKIRKFNKDTITDFTEDTYLVIMMWMLYLILFLTHI